MVRWARGLRTRRAGSAGTLAITSSTRLRSSTSSVSARVSISSVTRREITSASGAANAPVAEWWPDGGSSPGVGLWAGYGVQTVTVDMPSPITTTSPPMASQASTIKRVIR